MCRTLVDGDRQFSDEQIRKLIERNAVIGMALDAWMLQPGWIIGKTSRDVVSITTVADHVDHICQLAGDCAHVGIGSDLDGGFGTEQCPRELDSIADLHKLAPILESRGYSSADIDNIFFGNWFRFFSEALPNET
jgi:membrane dipeptidase